MMSQKEWKKLDFNASRDGKWTTVGDIKQRMAKQSREETRNKILVTAMMFTGFIFLSLIIWMMLQ